MKYLLILLLLMVTQRIFAQSICAVDDFSRDYHDKIFIGDTSQPTGDTLLLANDGDSLVMSKEDWDNITKYYPELLHQDFPESPGLLYAAHSRQSIYFDSEAGKDWYYQVYGFFLKRQNGAAKYAVTRKKLDNLFRFLNTLYGRLHCPFGTYYGHREERISGYVEYSVYLYTLYESNSTIQGNIAAQKKLYIAMLRQVIADEMEVDNDAVDCAMGRKKELLALVTQIDRLITDKFYLRQAQSFQYATYNY
ncbi:hypothetical protein MRBLMN1_000677 [Chitinophaga ginsengisegetis]|uniref:hypothetical protein n=1 Tax=Chitinophaga ginsengisegetis TaxID=393003 RepID=UPI000DBA6B47|nr:hypothetical protein [Chitinophaga ginsengisegetis]MDR6565767.1 hypothetical protein [Chitinophaga ginsengisegetis]MDR6645496.1 hypothetical protein [Chitinophaga ginsengisegetis]MDR6651912.1 hypothetical protein [Chitinophaga ginsengisegetis]